MTLKSLGPYVERFSLVIIISLAKFKTYNNIAEKGLKSNGTMWFCFKQAFQWFDIIDVVLFGFPLTEIHIYLEL